MFKDFDHDNFPFIISSDSDFKYEIHSIKNQIIPKVELLIKTTKHISLKAHDLIYYCPKTVDIKLKVLNNFVSINMDSISRNGSFCICLLGEEFENLSNVMSCCDPEGNNSENASALLKESIQIAAKSGYNWISDETETKEPSLLELLSMQAGLMTKIKFPLFYFRVSGGPLSDRDQSADPWKDDMDNTNPRMERLKQKLIRNGLPIRFYGSAAEFDEVVEKDILNIISNYPDRTKDQDDFSVDQSCFESAKLRYFTRNCVTDKMIIELDCFYSTLSEWTKSLHESSDSERIDLVIKDFHRKNFSDKLQSAYKKMSNATSQHSQSPCEGVRLLILTGGRGFGKSTILANWLSYKNDKDIVKFVHYCEASSVSSDLRFMLRRLINFIRSKCGFEMELDNGDAHSMECEVKQLNQQFLGALLLSQRIGLKLLIVIDGLDNLGDKCAQSSEQIKDIKWIPELIPENVRMVLTCAASDSSLITLRQSRDDVKVVETTQNIEEVLNSEDITQPGLEGLTAHISNYSQTCPENIFRNIKGWLLIENPMVQKILAHVYHTLGCIPTWSSFIDTISECQSVVELVRRVLKLWITYLNWEMITVGDKSLKRKITQNKEEKADEETFVRGWIPDCLSLIVLSINGLRIEAIPSLLESLGYVKDFYVTESDIWSLFHFGQDIMLRYHNGKIGFSHYLYKDIVAHTFMAIATCRSVEARAEESQNSMYTDRRCKLHILLANYFWTKRDEHEENIEECIYHLDMASDYQALGGIIFYPKVLLKLFNIEIDDLGDWLGHLTSISKFMYYLKILTARGYDLITKIMIFVNEHYGVSLEGCPDFSSTTALQLKLASATSSRSDERSSYQSDFAKRLRIDYQGKEERDILKSFSGNQSMRYLFLLGRIANLMQQTHLAMQIYSHVIKVSEEDTFVCHVMWSKIQLDNQHVKLKDLSELDHLTAKVLHGDGDMCMMKSVMYIRSLVLVQKCSMSGYGLGKNYIIQSISQVRSYAETVKSVVLDCHLLELESEAIEIRGNHGDIERKISLLSKAIVTMETWTGPFDLRLPKLWVKLGHCLRHGSYQSRLKAEACCRRAMSILETANIDNDSRWIVDENLCRELIISLLLQDICNSAVCEAKFHMYAAYDSRVKTLGCQHVDTKRLEPLIKVINTLENHLHGVTNLSTSNVTRKSYQRVIGNSSSKNNSTSVVQETRSSAMEVSVDRSNSGLIRDCRPTTGSSLQFINKYSNNSDTFQDDIDWDEVAEGSGIQTGSRNLSAFSKRSIPRSSRSHLLSCGTLRVSSTSLGSDVPTHIYSGHNSTLSYKDYMSTCHRLDDFKQTKQVRFSAGMRGPYSRQEMSSNIQAKLSKMMISSGHNWVPRKKSFSATFSRPYYSITDSLTH